MVFLKNKNILIHAVSLVILTIIFMNNVNQILLKSVFIEVEKTNKIVPKSQSNNKMYSFTSEDPKIIFSKRLSSEENYMNYLDRKCEVTGSFEDRFEEFQYFLFLIRSTVFFVLPTNFTI